MITTVMHMSVYTDMNPDVYTNIHIYMYGAQYGAQFNKSIGSL